MGLPESSREGYGNSCPEARIREEFLPRGTYREGGHRGGRKGRSGVSMTQPLMMQRFVEFLPRSTYRRGAFPEFRAHGWMGLPESSKRTRVTKFLPRGTYRGVSSGSEVSSPILFLGLSRENAVGVGTRPCPCEGWLGRSLLYMHRDRTCSNIDHDAG
jgi:hypothetical protein